MRQTKNSQRQSQKRQAQKNARRQARVRKREQEARQHGLRLPLGKPPVKVPRPTRVMGVKRRSLEEIGKELLKPREKKGNRK